MTGVGRGGGVCARVEASRRGPMIGARLPASSRPVALSPQFTRPSVPNVAGGGRPRRRAVARVCVIREWYFPVDERINREVDALLRDGHEVDIICARMPDQPGLERVGRVTVHRLPIARKRAGLLRYVFEFIAFQAAATVHAALLHLRRRYAVVQVNSLPDWLVFSAIVPRLLGARVLLDLH